MKKRLCIAGVLLAGLMFAVLYEASTHVVRGWLRGEAFYDGRPTSYWRERCDEWLERFDTPDKAARFVAPGTAVPLLGDEEIVSWVVLPKPARPATFWSDLMDRFRPEEDWIYDHWPPKVLFGHPGAEPVLEELVKEDPYKVVAARALRYAKEYRRHGAFFGTRKVLGGRDCLDEVYHRSQRNSTGTVSHPHIAKST